MKYDIGKYNNNWRELRVHREDKKSGGVGVVGSGWVLIGEN